MSATQPATVIGQDVNRSHGHIAVGVTKPDLVFTDYGNGRCSAWVYNHVELDAAGARALADELAWWADRADQITRTGAA